MESENSTALILHRLDELDKKLDKMDELHKKDFVSKIEFKVLENQVGLMWKVFLGVNGTILLSVGSAIIGLIIDGQI